MENEREKLCPVWCGVRDCTACFEPADPCGNRFKRYSKYIPQMDACYVFLLYGWAICKRNDNWRSKTLPWIVRKNEKQ